MNKAFWIVCGLCWLGFAIGPWLGGPELPLWLVSFLCVNMTLTCWRWAG